MEKRWVEMKTDSQHWQEHTIGITQSSPEGPTTIFSGKCMLRKEKQYIGLSRTVIRYWVHADIDILGYKVILPPIRVGYMGFT